MSPNAKRGVPATSRGFGVRVECPDRLGAEWSDCPHRLFLQTEKRGAQDSAFAIHVIGLAETIPCEAKLEEWSPATTCRSRASSVAAPAPPAATSPRRQAA